MKITDVIAHQLSVNVDDLSATRLTHAKGWVDVPTGPGLGIEIDRSILDRYRVA